MEIRVGGEYPCRSLAEFERYIDRLCEVLGHQDRHAGFADYSRGLMLPIERKSVEPLAAHTDPLHVSAKHQSLHHLVAHVGMVGHGGFGPCARLGDARAWAAEEPVLLDHGRYGISKKGTHSVGVARQYCGQLGKQDNCQVAVSVSLATEQGSVPIAWRLYLPEKWAKDRAAAEKGRCAYGS